MRIFLPLTTEDRTDIAASASRLSLSEGRAAWAVTAEVRSDRAGEDEEELEYDAIQDAVHVALGAVGPQYRALVIAADVPQTALRTAEDSGGAYGVAITSPVEATIASFHVTELDARGAAEDDTDPALLWFDATEGPQALAYLDAVPGQACAT